MMPRKKVSREHIFPNTELTPLAFEYKQCVAENRHEEARKLADTVIRKSTKMLERLAQHEKFTNTCDLDTLVSAAQIKIPKWLSYWELEKGELFSWFSTCAKNVFRSEVNKENLLRKRVTSSGDNLEKYYGEYDHGLHDSYNDSIITEADEVIKNTFVRWSDPSELGVVRYMIHCIIDNENHNKAASIRAATYAFGLQAERTKFFYGSSLIILRQIWYKRIHIPYSDKDIFRNKEKYSKIIDMMNIIGWDATKQVIAIMGGERIKIPTNDQLKKHKEEYNIYLEIESLNVGVNHADDEEGEDILNEELTEIAKKYRKKRDTIKEIHTRMKRELHPESEFSIIKKSNWK